MKFYDESVGWIFFFHFNSMPTCHYYHCCDTAIGHFFLHPTFASGSILLCSVTQIMRIPAINFYLESRRHNTNQTLNHLPVWGIPKISFFSSLSLSLNVSKMSTRRWRWHLPSYACMECVCVCVCADRCIWTMEYGTMVMPDACAITEFNGPFTCFRVAFLFRLFYSIHFGFVFHL